MQTKFNCLPMRLKFVHKLRAAFLVILAITLLIIEANLQKSLKETSDYKYALDAEAILAITDKKGIITYVNKNFCTISKYTEAELNKGAAFYFSLPN